MTSKTKSSKRTPAAKGRAAASGRNPVASKTAREPGAKAVANTAKPTTRENTKLSTMIALLQRKEGATIDQLAKATGWLSHSVRGAMSGSLKKKLGLTITSSKSGDVRVYRIGH
jgi:hypothetical protein